MWGNRADQKFPNRRHRLAIRAVGGWLVVILLISGCAPAPRPVAVRSQDTAAPMASVPPRTATVPPPTATISTTSTPLPTATTTIPPADPATAAKAFMEGKSVYLHDPQPGTILPAELQHAVIAIPYQLAPGLTMTQVVVGIIITNPDGKQDLAIQQSPPDFNWNAKQGVMTIELPGVASSQNAPVSYEIVLVSSVQSDAQNTIAMNDISNRVRIEVSSRTAPETGKTPAPTPLAESQNRPSAQGTPVALPRAPITAANAARVVPLAAWGYGALHAGALSPDNQSIAIGTAIGLLFYSGDTFQMQRFLPTSSSVRELVFSSDGKMLAVGMDSGYAIYDMESGQLLPGQSIGESKSVDCLAFSPDGERLAVGIRYGPTLIVHSATRQPLRTLDETGVSQVEFSPDGHILAVASDKEIHLWDLTSKEHIYFKRLQIGRTYRMAFSPDGKTLATGGSIQGVWDLKSGEVLHAVNWYIDGFTNVVFSSDGKTLITVADSGEVNLWNAQTMKAKQTIEAGKVPFRHVFLSPDGKRLVAVRLDGALVLRDLTGGNEKISAERVSEVLTNLTFSPDGQTLAVGSWNESIALWDPASGQVRKTLDGYGGRVESAAYSPDGKILAAIPNNNGVTLKDAASGATLHTIRTDNARAVFSPDGKLLVAQDWENVVLLIDPFSAKVMRKLKGASEQLISLAFSPDGKILAGGGYEDTMFAWDVSTGKVLYQVDWEYYVIESVVFSPDGKMLVIGGWDNRVVLVDASSGKTLRVLQGEQQPQSDMVKNLAFSPDGSLLASATENKIILLDVSSGQTLAELSGHTMQINGLAFSPDGTVLASAGEDGTVRLWGIKE